MIVDSHLHAWRAEPNALAKVATLIEPSSDIPIELALRYLDDHGVDRAVLVQPAFRGEDNGYLADVAALWPERFAAVCVVDPRLPGAEGRLEYWTRERGCRGLRLRPRLAGEAAVFADECSAPLWAKANELGVVVSILAGPEHLLAIGAWAERFPGVPIVLDHLAHPDAAAGAAAPAFGQLLDLARFPNVHVKLSGYYYFSALDYPHPDCDLLVKAVTEHFGARRILWGSDFPHVLLKSGYAGALAFSARTMPYLTEPDRARFLGGNAARLYWNNGEEGVEGETIVP